MGIIVYYSFCAVCSLVLLFLILFLIKQHNALHILFFIFVCAANFGYLLLALSASLSEALLANQITYLGSFLPILIILANSEFCKIKLPKPFVVLLLSLNAVQLFLVLSIRYSQIYYRSAYLGKYYGVSYLIKDYGPGHTYYLLLLLSETLFSALVVLYAILKKKNVAYVTVSVLSVGFFATVMVFFLERHIQLEVELVPVSYMLISILYLIISYRDQTYDIGTGIASVYEEQKNYVCISLDRKLRLMDYNKNASLVYPEVDAVHIDSAQYNKASNFYSDIILWVSHIKDGGDSELEKIIPVGDRFYKTSIRIRPRKLGYVVEMIDDTDFQNNLQLMVQNMKDLKVAEQTAMEASRAKSQFLANMSHEIRTPINAIMGMNEMILRTSDDTRITEYAGYIEEATGSLMSLINDILDFSKIEAGKMEIVETQYRLSAMIRSVVQMMSPRAQAKDLTFRTTVSPSLPDKLFGDENRIKQILINILSNAVKYTRKGYIHFAVDGEIAEENTVTLRFSVTDTGIGIRDEDIGKLFDTFERLDSRNNRNIEGTGLGLAITKRIVDKMEGTLTVDTEYGKGSTFTVTLEQRITGVGNVGDWQQTDPREHRSRERVTIQAPDMRILVVDDNRMNLKVIEKLLSDSQLTLDMAVSGQEAISKAIATDYHLVLMDHYMPDLDGLSAMQQIRKLNPAYESIPFVALTANAISGSEEFYKNHGFSDYLSKPVIYNDLIEVISKYIP
ncbi:MAG: response regulator [Lachnospiraceae bacterium]|nr:response regulator [Lachnospiraceae bacterium]